MQRWQRFLCAAALVALASPARAELNVFACEPEWAALATELGGERVAVFAATTARQDPHMIQARPSLIARLRRADLVVCTGAELEIGWMPVLLRQAANPRVQPGQRGYFEAAGFLALKEVPARLDRAEGDVHASGNPHIQTDPRNILAVAQALARRLAELDPEGAESYRSRAASFESRWRDAIAGWERTAAPLRGASVVVHHKNWVYLLDWLGLAEAGAIEPRPGVPASTAHLSRLLADIPVRRPRMILAAAYENPRAAEFVAEKSGLPLVVLPFTVGGSEAASDLFGLFDDTIRRMLAAAGERR
jgi:zinc/manganese transport system substrate-binding protein